MDTTGIPANRSRPTLYSFTTILGCALTCGCSMSQQRFASPQEAAGALVEAVRADDEARLREILGRGAEEVISSGDPVADDNAREVFLAAYDEKNTLATEADGSVRLEVGSDPWPLPIPLVEGRGGWRFDTQAGKEEVLNRRIGRNELSVQEVCLALVDAQREYSSTDRNGDGVPEYAQKLISDPGQRNGLYWEAEEGEPESPMGPLVAGAAAEGYGGNRQSGERRPYHGYYYKLLTSQGRYAPGGARDYMKDGRLIDGFAVLAWPAEYGNSGIMTFMVSHHGVVYEQDLGRRTSAIAESINTFDPDPDWRVP